jgi:hypothetical protein
MSKFKCAFGAALASVLSFSIALAPILVNAAEQATLTQRATVKQTTVYVQWVRNKAEGNRICASKGAPEYSGACAYGTTDSCNIVAIQPRDFNDTEALAVLGHEFWHCLGAKHE